MDFRTWYDALVKPSWTPSPGTISLIWTILYPIIAVTFVFVFVQTLRGKVPWLVALPFLINLTANSLFMPIFAGLRNIPLATTDILIVLGTIIWGIVAMWPHYRWVATAQIPYLMWVGIATVLQISIALTNR
jgi:benzodiazapine receptor